MSGADPFDVGLAFARRAIHNDRTASVTKNVILYQSALADYSRAIEMLSLASLTALDDTCKKLLNDKINTCRFRKLTIEDHLKPAMPAVPISGTTSTSVVENRREEHQAEYEDLHHLFKRLNVSREHTNSLPPLDSVFGLENAKEVLREATMFPKFFPDMFKTRRAWKTILLYGPPGVGKTHISKAIASESKFEYFSLSAGELMATSNCERVVKDLFAAAKRSGSVIFCLEDVDILFPADCTNETEHLRRMKGQLLTELQALRRTTNDVVFIAVSRTPWLLEEAFLSRMDRRVHIDLPNAKSRAAMLRKLLQNVPHALAEDDIENIATECETYSGADLNALVMDAEMEPLRVVQLSTHFRIILAEENGKKFRMISPCGSGDEGAIATSYASIQKNMFYIPPVTCLDFEVATDRTKPTVGLETIQKHLDFSRGNR